MLDGAMNKVLEFGAEHRNIISDAKPDERRLKEKQNKNKRKYLKNVLT